MSQQTVTRSKPGWFLVSLLAAVMFIAFPAGHLAHGAHPTALEDASCSVCLAMGQSALVVIVPAPAPLFADAGDLLAALPRAVPAIGTRIGSFARGPP